MLGLSGLGNYIALFRHIFQAQFHRIDVQFPGGIVKQTFQPEKELR